MNDDTKQAVIRAGQQLLNAGVTDDFMNVDGMDVRFVRSPKPADLSKKETTER